MKKLQSIGDYKGSWDSRGMVFLHYDDVSSIYYVENPDKVTLPKPEGGWQVGDLVNESEFDNNDYLWTVLRVKEVINCGR